jgi:tetratricopeptide (TPR) repeat protein/predicted Ser/Thr protein kinase
VSRSKGDRTLTARDRLEATPPPDVELSIGARIGRYVIEERLGAGGMGVVYSAWDTALARSIALKIVRPRGSVDSTQARLRREAKAMARLSHRNVVPVFDIATHDDRLFIAMELVEGEPLRAWVTRPRPWREVLALFVKAGHGLEAAHAAGLVHRDFKPDNVMVGDRDEPRITDFGLARELVDAEPSQPPAISDHSTELLQVTATGSFAGTPAYMAPEQLLDNVTGPAADQFSFCVALFEVLYGERPFQPAVREPDALLDEVRAGRVAKPDPTTRGVPRRLHAAVVRGLAYSAEDRWPSMAALVAELERCGRRRRGGRLYGGIAVVVAVGAIALSRVGGERAAAPSCAEIDAKGNDAVTIVACKDDYVRSKDPRAGRRLADALRRTGNLKDAAIAANELLTTPERANALYTLGKIAADEGRDDDAARLLQQAGELHRQHQQWADAAADELGLAGVSRDVVEQLVSLDRAVIDARRGGSAKTEAYCHLAAARRLSEIGARVSALDELDRAAPLLTEPSDRTRLEVERGNAYQNLGDHALAVAALERARAEVTGNTARALSLHLNLAYSLAALGRHAEAAAELAEARALDANNHMLGERLTVEAWAAARSDELAGAAALIDRAIAAAPADQQSELLEREVLRADIALARGELAAAEAGARHAISQIEARGSTRPPAALRSWLTTANRIPYEILFASLARRGDAAAALAVFDRAQGLSVLTGLTHGGSHATQPGIAFPAEALAELVPALDRSALSGPAPDDRLAEVVRSRSLLVLVVARGDVWRITAARGVVEVARIGELAALQPQIDRLRADLHDHAAAAALGALMVPAALASSDQLLDVVLDPRLAGLPVAALRRGDRKLVAIRPLVQPARPSEAGCAMAPGGPRRVVAIDASGDAAARLSGTWPGATRAALFGVARGDLLHLAVATEPSPLGDAAVLGNDRISAIEIAAHGNAPAQIVLANRDSSAQGGSYLVMGFLAAGAEQVLAAVTPVANAAVQRLTDELHRANPGGSGDLARALAGLQADGDDDWLGFAVHGRASCKPLP